MFAQTSINGYNIEQTTFKGVCQFYCRPNRKAIKEEELLKIVVFWFVKLLNAGMQLSMFRRNLLHPSSKYKKP
jgi:hypothetical protein